MERTRHNSQHCELRDNQDKTLTPIEGAKWADWDQPQATEFRQRWPNFRARKMGLFAADGAGERIGQFQRRPPATHQRRRIGRGTGER